MKNAIAILSTALLATQIAPHAHAQQAASRPSATAAPALTATLRLGCDDESIGAEVSINGQFRGECPFDAMVPEGVLNIRAVKAVGADKERVFEQQLRVGVGTAVRREIVLGLPQLTAVARQREEARQEAERQARAEAERQAQAALQADWSAADQGNPNAMLVMAERYMQGKGVAKDAAQARAWLVKAAEAGNAEAMFRLGEAHEMRWPPFDYGQARLWYGKAAEAGHAGGMAGLGAMHINGQGGPVNDAQARLWFERAAQAGNGRGMNGMASLYEEARGGMPKNMALSTQWRDRALATGDVRAMLAVGWQVIGGERTGRETPAQALNLIRQAADAGWPVAMHYMGYVYMEGKGGLEKNDVIALDWFHRAADLGVADAMVSIGYLQERGRGGLKASNALAIDWYRKAAEAGSETGRRNLQILRGQ
ncbi:MAG: tetratricopeptide repeat protein [Moraxellaceae bacterium]|nr:tetratricopeptide repeat protein [Moraxellaceae bacterium]